MGIITRLFGDKTEKRGSPSDPIFWQQFTQILQMAASGQVVTSDTAMSQSTVYACVKIHSQTLASLPLFLYRRKPDGSRVTATNKRLFDLLHDQPNDVWSSFEFKEYLIDSVLLRGNAYCWREYNNAGELIALWPLSPDTMTLEVSYDQNGKRWISEYKYTIPNTTVNITFAPYEIWHLKDGIGSDGVSGASRIEQCKNTIGLSLSADEYGSKFFANDATPGGILTYPGQLDPDVKKDAIKSWDELHRSSKKAFKTAILEAGLQFTPLTMKNEDAQFIQTRAFQVADICRIFRVPTIMVGGAGDSDKSNTYASAEQQMLSFVQNTIRPFAVRIERNIFTNLLDAKERKNHFAEFKLDALLRGDIKTRYEAYQMGRQNSWLSPNDIRKLENLDPIEVDGADDYIMPANFVPIDEEPEPLPTPAQGELPMEGEEEEDMPTGEDDG